MFDAIDTEFICASNEFGENELLLENNNHYYHFPPLVIV